MLLAGQVAGTLALEPLGNSGIYVLQFLTALKLLSKLVQLGLKVRPAQERGFWWLKNTWSTHVLQEPLVRIVQALAPASGSFQGDQLWYIVTAVGSQDCLKPRGFWWFLMVFSLMFSTQFLVKYLQTKASLECLRCSRWVSVVFVPWFSCAFFPSWTLPTGEEWQRSEIRATQFFELTLCRCSAASHGKPFELASCCDGYPQPYCCSPSEVWILWYFVAFFAFVEYFMTWESTKHIMIKTCLEAMGDGSQDSCNPVRRCFFVWGWCSKQGFWWFWNFTCQMGRSRKD